MSGQKVTIYLQTADKTRKAEVTVPRSMQVSALIKASGRRWFMVGSINYQVANLTTGKYLLPSDTLNSDKVHNHDVLMLQPFATHGT